MEQKTDILQKGSFVFLQINQTEMAVFGYLPKLKRGLGLAFDTNFLHDFSA